MAPDSTGTNPLPQSYLKPPIRLARDTLGSELIDGFAQPDMKRMRAYRLGRLREQLKKRDYCGALFYDPINIRYATGSRNMQVWTTHNPARYCYVPTEGPVTLFDFHNCEHLADGIETIAEVRAAKAWYYFAAAENGEKRAKAWADELADVIARSAGGNKRLAVDRLDPMGVQALAKHGYSIHDGQECSELARVIKSADEIACMNISISVCEAGMAKMREMLKPGMTENEVWSHLHQVNIAKGGEWLETRLLTSGGRTNPWFQESSDRVIRAGELVSFDTDLIGPVRLLHRSLAHLLLRPWPADGGAEAALRHGLGADPFQSRSAGPGRALPRLRREELQAAALLRAQPLFGHLPRRRPLR